MTYKQEEHQKLAKKFQDEVKDMPTFIVGFFYTFKGQKTQNVYLVYIRLFLKWLIEQHIIEKKELKDITPNDMKKLDKDILTHYFYCLHNGIGMKANSLTTIQTKINIFHKLWNYFIKEKYVDNNIIDLIDRGAFKPDSNHKITLPSDEELKTLYKQIDNINNDFVSIRNLAITKLFLGSGIRLSELVGLDLNDLHLNNVSPYIEVIPKGNAEHKTRVNIAEETRQTLVEYIKHRNNRPNSNLTPAVFISSRSPQRISISTIHQFFRNCSNNTIHPHILRHLLGTTLWEKTGDIELVKEQLGHKHIQTTSNFYVQVKHEKLYEALSSINV